MKFFHLLTFCLLWNPCHAFFWNKILSFLCQIPFLDLILPCPRDNDDDQPVVKVTEILSGGGGTVNLDGVGSVTFPNNSFDTEVDVTVEKTEDEMMSMEIKQDTSIFPLPGDDGILSYQVVIDLSQPPTTDTFQVTFDIPPDFVDTIPEGYFVETFARIAQDSESDSSFTLFELMDDCSVQNQQVTCNIPSSAFVETESGGFSAVVTLGATNGNCNGDNCDVPVNQCQAAEISCPVQGGCTVISPYESGKHLAVDYVAAQETPILAAVDGIVEKVEELQTLGGTIVIRHADGVSATRYCHLSLFSVNVGLTVQAGQQIGLSGGTPGSPMAGLISTGPHLHLEYTPNGNFYKNKNRIDPDLCIVRAATLEPTDPPTLPPTLEPTPSPLNSPTDSPTKQPSSLAPTRQPSSQAPLSWPCIELGAPPCYFSCADVFSYASLCGFNAGEYPICPDATGAVYNVFCDNSNGSDWMLQYSYNHVAGNNDELVGGLIPLDPDSGYSHFFVNEISGYSIDHIEALRFYCTTTGHERIIHFENTDPVVKEIAFFGDQSNNQPQFWNNGRNTTSLYSDHSGILPLTTGFWPVNIHTTDGGFHNFPFYQGGVAHWAIRGNVNPGVFRWECDDDLNDAILGVSTSTTHNVWVRIASTPLESLQTYGILTGTISLGLDRSTDPPTFWTYSAQVSNVQQYDSIGNILTSFDPVAITDSADIEIYDGPLTINGTSLVEGTKHVLFMNGATNNGANFIPVITAFRTDGTVVAQVQLQSNLGTDQSVGFTYHRARGTFFLISWVDDSVSEMNPETGVIINRFDLPVIFDVFFGDISVDPATGNLFVISSQETRILEITPDGNFVRLLMIPEGIDSQLTGLSVACGEIWLASRNLFIYRIGPLGNIEAGCT